VEPFGGGAAVLLAKSRSSVEVYNDLNGDVVNFFAVLRERPNELISRLLLTPYSRSEYQHLLQEWHVQRPVEPVDRAYEWFCLQDQSFNSKFNSGFSSSKARNDADPWASRPGKLYEVAARLRGVIIENLDFADIIPRYDSPETVFYIDPPYIGCRSDYYPGFKLSDDDHRRLAILLNEAKGRILVSYYDHPLLQELYPNWIRESIDQKKGAAYYAGIWYRADATEILLMNFHPNQRKLFSTASTAPNQSINHFHQEVSKVPPRYQSPAGGPLP
jgi:DNA adenine methylase